MEDLKQIDTELTKGTFTPAMNFDNIQNMIPREDIGLYCISVIDISDSGFNSTIQGEFKQLFDKTNESIIYIGKAGKSIRERLFQELRAKSNGTFFRSLGAVLNYEPPSGSLKNRTNKINYKFNKSDQDQIIKWINKHLEFNWVNCSQNIGSIEKELIKQHTPLLNIDGNPNASQLVKDKRKHCREIAAG